MKGYFRKRGDTWSYTVDIGIDPSTGDRKQKTKGGFRTKKEAQIKAAALIQELDQGVYAKEADMNFKEFAVEWLELYRNSENVKVSTIRVRKYSISKLSDYLDYYKMKLVTRKIYQGALNSLKKLGLSEGSLRSIHGTGRIMFKKAMELKYIKVDPTEYVVIPRTMKTVEDLEEETDLPRYLEKEELAVFLNESRRKGIGNDYLVFLALAYTGMRAGELCALKWRDIDFEKSTISITKTYFNESNKTADYVILTPKTKDSKRIIDIDQVVLTELENHRTRQNIVKMAHRDTYHDQDFIFTKMKNFYGYPDTVPRIEWRMARLLKLSNLNVKLTPHSLRHTHTSLLAEAGVGLEEIMERLGHSDDKITRRVYLHVTKTMKKEASQKFSELMRSL